MSSAIRAILFDFGNTLMHPRHAWLPVYKEAGQALGEFLCANRIEVDCSNFADEFRRRIDEYYIEREQSLVETTSLVILQALLAEKGYRNLSEEFLREALGRFYIITQKNWDIEEDAVPTLTALRSNGLRIGLVSNASDSRDVAALIDKFDIRPYFDFILTSADCGHRKPHPRIFQLALAHWNFMPSEVAMVGDRLDADVGGAHPLGMYTIWIKRRAGQLDPAPAHPDAIVQALSEIPPLLSNRAKDL